MLANRVHGMVDPDPGNTGCQEGTNLERTLVHARTPRQTWTVGRFDIVGPSTYMYVFGRWVETREPVRNLRGRGKNVSRL